MFNFLFSCGMVAVLAICMIVIATSIFKVVAWFFGAVTAIIKSYICYKRRAMRAQTARKSSAAKKRLA